MSEEKSVLNQSDKLVVCEKPSGPPPPKLPSPPNKAVSVVDRIDKIISERAEGLVEKMRVIRSTDGLQFQGMTKQQIREHFQVAFTQNENYLRLRQKTATVVVLRQEASNYLKALEAERDLAAIYVNEIRDQMDQEIIMSNLTAGRNDKISDKAREALTKRIYQVGNIGTALAEIGVEVGMWKSVLKDMDKVSEGIGQVLQSLASENKYSGSNHTT